MARQSRKQSAPSTGLVQEEFDMQALMRQRELLEERLREMERAKTDLAAAREEADHTLPPSSLWAEAASVSLIGARASKLQERSLRRQQCLGILGCMLFSGGSVFLLWWAFRLMGG